MADSLNLALLVVAFVAYPSATLSSVHGVDGEAKSYVEIRTHGHAVHAAGSASKNMLRRELSPVGAEHTNHTLGERIGKEADVHLGFFLSRTIRTLQRKEHQPSLLQGPGTLTSGDDPFTACLSMMYEYDKNISSQCSRIYGQDMLEKLMDKQSELHVCAGAKSSIVCHERDPFDVNRYMCCLNNVVISRDGTWAPGCNPNAYESFILSAGITEWNIFGKYTKLKGLKVDDNPVQCSRNGSQKALVQVAADVHNFYEWYGDWVTLWETMAALNWHPAEVDLYLVGKIADNDGKYIRPFDEAWVRMFKNRLHVGSMDELFGSGTCFQQIVTVPQGSLSTISFNGGRDGIVSCASPLVMSSALYLQSLFPLPPATSDGKKHVTVLMRKSGARAWMSDIMVIRDIEDVLPTNWTVSSYHAEDMPTFESQLAVVQNTQVFVGTHGAGMMHILFLPPNARVVEVFCGDRPRENHHYRNLEHMGEPGVGSHLFNYYFDSDSSSRCQIDPAVVVKAIRAYEAGLAA